MHGSARMGGVSNQGGGQSSGGGGGPGSPYKSDIITVSAGDVTNGYLQLSGDLTESNSLFAIVNGAPGQINGLDFGPDLANDRLIMTGFGFASVIAAGDVVQIHYN